MTSPKSTMDDIPTLTELNRFCGIVLGRLIKYNAGLFLEQS
jgi:hypothetical protein